mmetsp:Transcript_9440/g.10760  ORF Transcript_9440/g.10760 Transcript_9440/m.10760 type:complete len:220 (+) Transcript_9440:114-773(+)
MCDAKANKVYKTVEYWDERFKTEEAYEWLTSFKDVELLIRKHTCNLLREKQPCSSNTKEALDTLPSVLVVGCGNSSFSSDLCSSGAENLISIDYSETVIERMRQKHPEMEWKKMDMTKMDGFEDDRFDYIIDKAAMDALVTDEGDPWNPSESALNSTGNMIKEVYRTLKPGGKFLQISFQQPHFRKLYLNHSGFTNQDVVVEHIDVGMGYFMYTLTKKT